MIISKISIIKAGLVAASCMVSSIATAVPITFDNFNGTFPYTENGFTVMPTQTPSDGGWGGALGGIGTQSGGRIGTKPNGDPDYGTPAGTIEVTCNDNGLFFFNSVDLFGGPTEMCNYTIVGSLNGSTVLSEGGSLKTGDPSTDAYALINGNPSLQIDSLFITLYTSPYFRTYFNMRNIDVASVPDNSSTLVLFGIGASALMIFGRKQLLIPAS